MFSSSLFTTFMRNFSHWTNHHFNFCKHAVFPAICLLCDTPIQSAQNICLPCLQDLPILTQRCYRCAQFLSGTTGDSTCGNCLKKPPLFDRTYTLFAYQTPVLDFIIRLKFHGELLYATMLGELLSEQIQHSWYCNQAFPDLIVPVPLHKERLRKRGYNQALEIAKPIAKQLKIPLDKYGIKRTKPTLPQSNLSAKDRKKNVATAFSTAHSYQGLFVAILDDVITTGATVAELSKVLKKQGATRIDVWSCARR